MRCPKLPLSELLVQRRGYCYAFLVSLCKLGMLLPYSSSDLNMTMASLARLSDFYASGEPAKCREQECGKLSNIQSD